MRKFSRWYQVFFIFTGLWTVGSASFFYGYFPKESKKRIELIREVRYEKIAEGITEREKEELVSNIEGDYKRNLHEYYKSRRRAIFTFPLYWLVPIGSVYGAGRYTGIIISGFRKVK